MQTKHEMEALQITAPNKILHTKLAVPEPKDGEILIKTAFVGICGTDVHLWLGKSFYYDYGFLKFPFVFGHEYTGTVIASRGVNGFREGDRVVGHCMVECHLCDNCRKGRRHLCRNLKEVGLRYIPGAASEYLCVPAYAVTRVPDNLPLKAATLVEPTVTAYHAVERAQVRTDDKVAVIGTGTLGLLALMIAKLTAESVDVIGLEQSELEYAKVLGADRALRPEEAPENGYSVVIEASGAAPTLGLAARILDLGGRCSLIGVINRPAVEFIPSLVTLKDQTFHGILHGLDYYPQTVQLFASGRLDPTKLIADVRRPTAAPGMFQAMVSPNRSKPKYVIEFAGEKV
ncbi:zinc-binding dehydrogenase [Bradyrhizobium sp. WSM3983]|uniref:zinc-dependent alcohol dehydrogenase n=1 Tax=Bradyrhizobium sp. WSM3983 TaxID=1038867 RepID=UPI0004262830|nr:alcohol dehydrogenase catalytic domain-containing protein [Bradyrhizobium sp. WSM3983]